MASYLKSLIGMLYSIIYGLKIGRNVYITPSLKVRCVRGNISIGNNVSLSASTILLGVTPTAKIEMCNNIRIAHHFQISCANIVKICSDVNVAPFVFITDHNHKFEDPYVPIKDQGIIMKSDSSVVIGEGSWIGTKAVIVGNVKIGRHCVVGANSVVTKDIPDYSIAVGSPAKVVKHYDFDRKEWVKI
ncbi:MAG TPA: acyltransferase [Candidatus Paraprevotella stercorigallinarum]|nr:acyltransferase [Candidatus Paraprevotella stercorigallinarum]